MIKKILIFGHSNIGDVIYDLAVVDPLLKHYPDAKISFLTSSRCSDIVDGYRGIHNIIIFDRHGNYRGFLDRIRFTMRLKKEKFDLVVVLKDSLNHIFLRASEVWPVPKSAGLQNNHPVDRYIDMLRSHGLMVEDVSFSFSLKDNDIVFCEDFLRQKDVATEDILVGILPLAAWPLKSLPIAKWNKLAEILNQRWGIKMLNLGKFPDNRLGRSAACEISKTIIPADNTNLIQAKALLKRCQMFIGPDSSFLHLASSMGIETIGLYGPTSCELFYPYFHKQNIILPRNRLSCMPCYPGNRPSCCADNIKHDFGPCMDGIRVEDIVELVRVRLNLN